MSTDEFQQIWKAYDAKLEKSLKLNQQLLEEIGSAKVRRSFYWLIVGKIFMIAFGVAWNMLCGAVLWHMRTEPVFVVSAILVIAFTSFGIAGYVFQLLIILRLNFYKSILDTQKDLALLETVMIWTYRIQVLQAPVYTFFFLTKGMIAHMGLAAWILQGCLTGGFIVLSVWVYRHVSVRNMNKRWMKKLMNNEGWKSIARARHFIREIEDFKKEG